MAEFEFFNGGGMFTHCKVHGNSWRVVGAACFALALAACGADRVVETDTLLAAAQSEVGVSRAATNLSKTKGVVRVALTAKATTTSYDGKRQTNVWAYNGSVPGPRIEANVGDELVVRFTNRLPVSTTVHWHGLDVPALMDGSHISQRPVEPGESKTYRFKLLRPGTYWYHPHIDSFRQVERGLYGALVVRDPAGEKKLKLPKGKRERTLILDDVLLDAHGQVAPPFPADPLANAAYQVNGREGNLLLVNGRSVPTLQVRSGKPVRLRLINAANARLMRLSLPGHTLYRIGGDGGLAQRAQLHPEITQVAAGGHGDMYVSGAMAGPMMMMSDPNPKVGLLLTPGERADVVFTPRGKPSRKLYLEWHDYPRGRHAAFRAPDGSIAFHHAHDDGMRPPRRLLKLQFGKHDDDDGDDADDDDDDDDDDGDDDADDADGDKKSRDWTPPRQLSRIARIDTRGARALPVTYGHGAPDSNGDVMFFATRINGVGIPFAKLTPAEALKARVGETAIWEVTNLTMGDHNFHPHGFSFQQLETEFIDMDTPANNRKVLPAVLENKDTIHVPARPGAMMRSRTVVRLAVTFDDTGRRGKITAAGKTPTDTTSGGWFVHCHLLEHAKRGMGTFLELEK